MILSREIQVRNESGGLHVETQDVASRITGVGWKEVEPMVGTGDPTL